MWMVGHDDGGEVSMGDHSFNGRKLRPLNPRPMTSSNNTSITPPCLSRIHGSDFFTQYHDLASLTDQSKREFNNPLVVVSSRWNPTPEQLRALEELYRRGTRTLSAEEIQHITQQLRRFGKIEGKNVFYWFQNHKARERQKRRRQMESVPRDFDGLDDKEDFDVSRTVFEVEQTKNWALSMNCSTLAEESVSIPRATKALVAGRKTDGWIQFNEGELQQRRNLMERNATWRMMQLSCPSPSPAAASTHLINTSTASIASTSMVTARAIDPKLIKAHDLSFFISPDSESTIIHFNSISNQVQVDNRGEPQTLELFPLRSVDGSDNVNHKESEISVSAVNANFPSQFFEFLPLKN